jgi:hypothetical protein
MNRTSIVRRRARARRYRWARKYRPSDIDVLLIAEAPPSALDRYFYFPDVATHDSLFRETVRAVLGLEPSRVDKLANLTELKTRGICLMDACVDPLDGPLRVDVGRLIARVRRLNPRRIIIVKASVFDRVFRPLAAADLPVINVRVPFPGSGQQVRFRQEMRRALRKQPEARNTQG